MTVEHACMYVHITQSQVSDLHVSHVERDSDEEKCTAYKKYSADNDEPSATLHNNGTKAQNI